MSLKHMKMDQFDQNFKIAFFLLFPYWLFFQLSFGAKTFSQDYGDFIDEVIKDWKIGEKLILRKKARKVWKY